MFLDAEAVTEEKDGEEVKYLSVTNATGFGSAGKRARLTGRMNEKITQDGGLLIGSDNIVVSLRSMGLSMVTIDTDKGEDMPDNVKPLTDPSRSRRPKIAWSTTTKRLSRPWKSAPRPPTPSRRHLQDVAEGKEMDVEKVQEAGGVISEQYPAQCRRDGQLDPNQKTRPLHRDALHECLHLGYGHGDV